MQRTWIMAAFLDIRGFGTWIYRANIPREVKEPFLEEYLGIVQGYLKAQKDIHFKYLGDGFLVIKEFRPYERKNGAVFQFILDLKCVARKIIKAIKKCHQPPDGVRVRIADGYAYKAMVIDPNDSERRVLVPEYIDYVVNMAERLMEVNADIHCVVTEGVAKSLGAYRSVFRCRKLGAPSTYPKGVNIEDLKTLEVLKF